MNVIKLPFGNDSLVVRIPDKNLSRIILPSEPEVTDNAVSLIEKALDNPVNSRKLSEIVKPDSSVAVIVSDTTRPVPTAQILPLIIDQLHQGGVADENITIIFALGLHRNQHDSEMERIVGPDIYRCIRCIEHDRSRCRMIGKTSRGTPVEVFEEVLDSDVIVCTGNIEFHYYAGYSGGAKAILPGVSSKDSIISNHRMMMEAKASSGMIDSPVREDIEEAAQYIGVDFLFNVVLDSRKNIVCFT